MLTEQSKSYKPKAVLGIDLGTTNTVAYVYIRGDNDELKHVHQIKFNGEASSLPSVVSFEMLDKEYEMICGYETIAQNMKLASPDNYFYSFKRLMGKSDIKMSPDLLKLQEMLTYQFTDIGSDKKAGGPVKIKFAPKKTEIIYFDPVEASSAVLRKVYEQVVNDYDITHSVITVPAHFRDTQKLATLAAAKAAKLPNPSILLEPVSAAMYHVMEDKLFTKENEGKIKEDDESSKNFIVVDFGGGTLDISAIEGSISTMQVIVTVGDVFLGGDNVTDELYKHFTKKINKMNLGGALKCPKMQFKLRKAVDDLKIRLCAAATEDDIFGKKETECFFDFILGGVSQTFTLKLEEFNEIIQPVIDAFEKIIRVDNVHGLLAQISSNGSEVEDFKDILCVGGSSKIPAVRNSLKKIFPDAKIRVDLDPDMVVAKGAAYMAAQLASYIKEDDTKLFIDVIPFPIGVCVNENDFEPIIAAQSTVPAIGEKKFTTAVDNQDRVLIKMAQGFSDLFSENHLMGTVQLDIKNPAPRGQTDIEIKIEWESSGKILLTATDRGSNISQNLTFVPPKGIYDDESIEREKAKFIKDEPNRIKREAIRASLRNLESYIGVVKSRLEQPEINAVAKEAVDKLVFSVEAWIRKNKTSAGSQEIDTKLNEFRTKAEELLNGTTVPTKETAKEDL